MSAPHDEEVVTIDVRERERRMYDRLRAKVVAPEPGASSGLRDLMLLIPDLTVLLMRLLADARVPFGAKLIAGAGVGYVLSPIDLLPEFLFGPLGLIDDLLVLAAAFSTLLNRVHPDLVRSHWSGRGDALAAIRRLTNWSETQITGRLFDFAGLLTRRLRR